MSSEAMEIDAVTLTSPGYHPVCAKSFLDKIVLVVVHFWSGFLLSSWFNHCCGPVGTSQICCSVCLGFLCVL